MSNFNTPEPSLDPPDDDKYVTAGCGHEVYKGETIVTWDGKTLCPDCFWDKVKEKTIEELASDLNCDFEKVG